MYILQLEFMMLLCPLNGDVTKIVTRRQTKN